MVDTCKGAALKIGQICQSPCSPCHGPCNRRFRLSSFHSIALIDVRHLGSDHSQGGIGVSEWLLVLPTLAT
jgi:hypothetical protein